MSRNLAFQLSQQDIDYYRKILTAAQQRATHADEETIIQHARSALKQIDLGSQTSFMRAQLKKLRMMVEMLDDKEWPLDEQERLDVVSALAYFYRDKDAIDDELGKLAAIDDAIIVELVVRELQHEIDAYREFCEFRASAEKIQGKEVSREDWYKARQHEIFERMRNRLDRHQRTTGGVGNLTTFSLA